MSMQSHAWAIGWSIWAKNRGLFLAMAAYLLVSSIAVRMLPVRENPVVARLWVMPAVVLLTMLVVVFTMPETGPKSKPRHEGFPARLFTLPVPDGRPGWLVDALWHCDRRPDVVRPGVARNAALRDRPAAPLTGFGPGHDVGVLSSDRLGTVRPLC